jgi:hypothetical protein
MLASADQSEDASEPQGIAPDAGPAHLVHFYENELLLCEAVSGFVSSGLTAGASALLVSTTSRADSFRQHLRKCGIDVEEQERAKRLVFADAKQLLSNFMRGPMPDPVLFRQEVEARLS